MVSMIRCRTTHSLVSPFVYRSADGIVGRSVPSKSERPLVLMLGWSNSTVKVLSKYAAVYNSIVECDALMLASMPRLVYRPSTATAAMKSVAEDLKSDALSGRPLIVAGFSVGAYLYSHLVRHIREREDDEKTLAPRIKAIVFDSPVDFGGVPTGLSKSITTHPVLQPALKTAIETYLSVFKAVDTEYRDVSRNLHDHPYAVPSLWLYSDTDFAATPHVIKQVFGKQDKRQEERSTPSNRPPIRFVSGIFRAFALGLWKERPNSVRDTGGRHFLVTS